MHTHERKDTSAQLHLFKCLRKLEHTKTQRTRIQSSFHIFSFFLCCHCFCMDFSLYHFDFLLFFNFSFICFLIDIIYLSLSLFLYLPSKNKPLYATTYSNIYNYISKNVHIYKQTYLYLHN